MLSKMVMIFFVFDPCSASCICVKCLNIRTFYLYRQERLPTVTVLLTEKFVEFRLNALLRSHIRHSQTNVHIERTRVH